MSQAPYTVRGVRFGTKLGKDLAVSYYVIIPTHSSAASSNVQDLTAVYSHTQGCYALLCKSGVQYFAPFCKLICHHVIAC